MTAPPIVYSWWTFWLFPVWGSYELCCSGPSCSGLPCTLNTFLLHIYLEWNCWLIGNAYLQLPLMVSVFPSGWNTLCAASRRWYLHTSCFTSEKTLHIGLLSFRDLVSHCDFNLDFPDYKQSWAPFHTLVGISTSIFWEFPLQVPCLFFYWVACLFPWF